MGLGDWGDDDADFDDDRIDFAEPGGRSALRAATRDDPRDLPCPTCRAPNRLTRRDRPWAINATAVLIATNAADIKPPNWGTAPKGK